MQLPQGKQITQAQLQILRQQQQQLQQQPQQQQQAGSPQIKAVNKPQQVPYTRTHIPTHTCLVAAIEQVADTAFALLAGGL